jgi:invasion protein IalB
MRRQNGFAPVRTAWPSIALATVFGLATSIAAIAQDASVGPKSELQSKKSAPPTTAPPLQPTPTEPAPAPVQAQVPAPAQAQVPAPVQAQVQAPVQLVYSPWTKICGKDSPPANTKVVCLIVKEARIREARPEIGQFAASAALVESEDEPKKILRVILPLGMQIQPGTRVFIDQGPSTQRPYLVCFANGCMSDYDADAAMVTKLAKGQELVIQAIESSGQPVTVKLPLADFAKAYDGPPIDPKVLEERQKRLQEEVQGTPKGNAGE